MPTSTLHISLHFSWNVQRQEPHPRHQRKAHGKDASDIVWYNDAQPLSLLSDLSAPLDTLRAATSKGTSLKGKESAVLVSGNHTIRATLKAQGSLTGFFSRRIITSKSSHMYDFISNQSPLVKLNSTYISYICSGPNPF